MLFDLLAVKCIPPTQDRVSHVPTAVMRIEHKPIYRGKVGDGEHNEYGNKPVQRGEDSRIEWISIAGKQPVGKEPQSNSCVKTYEFDRNAMQINIIFAEIQPCASPFPSS